MSVIPLNPNQSKSFDSRLDDVEANIINLDNDNIEFNEFLNANLQLTKDMALNIKDFWVNGYASWTAAIQAAVDYVNGLGGGEVLIPLGTYSIKGTINLKDKVLIRGVASIPYDLGQYSASILQLEDSSVTSMLSLTNLKSVGLKNITLKGNKDNLSGSTCKGINVTTVNSLLMDNVKIEAFAGVGLFINGGLAIRVQNCNFTRNSKGMDLKCTDSKFSHNYFYSNDGDGVTLRTGANTNYFLDNKFEWNKGYGVYAETGIYDCNFTSNMFDRNDYAGLYWLSGGENTFLGNLFMRNSAINDTATVGHCENVYLDNPRRLVWQGNVLLKAAANDDGSGAVIPNKGMILNGCDKATINGNNFEQSGNSQEITLQGTLKNLQFMGNTNADGYTVNIRCTDSAGADLITHNQSTGTFTNYKGDFRAQGIGKGFVCYTPDGAHTYRICVNNAGALQATMLT